MCYWWFIVIGLGILLLASIILLVIAEINGEYGLSDLSIGGIIIFGCAFVIITGISIGYKISAKAEYYQYQEKYEYVMQVIDSRKEFENLGITQTILDYNSWLEKAKTSKQVFGKWSWYQFYDVESMKYLGVE